MRAEILSIGDELTTGQRLDTNSQWLALRLGEYGVRVAFHTTVGDDLDDNVRVFRQAAERADIVVATGGLGPTADDLTREALAAVAGVELVEDAASLAHIRALFARRGRPMPERNAVQALFPRGSRVVPNPHGSAPGIDLDVPRPDGTASRIFALPGVPAEMREMWFGTVGPALERLCGAPVRHFQVRCFGVGESDLEQMLPDLIRRGRDPLVGITVSQATITLRITAAAESDAAFRTHIRPTLDVIHECLGPLVFGYGEDELQHAIVRRLRERGQTLSVAEWGTGGVVATWLTEADPTGDTFRGGAVLRSAAACAALGAEPGATAEPDAAVLAAACRRHFGTDWSLVVGPFPEPNTNPPGQVALAVCDAQQTRAKAVTFAGHPDILLARAGKQALDLLRLRLCEGSD